MKKQDRIQVIEEHTMWNSKIIFALFWLILLFGIVTGIGFYQVTKQMPKGEWECVDSAIQLELICRKVIVESDGDQIGLKCSYYQNCTKYQHVKYGD